MGGGRFHGTPPPTQVSLSGTKWLGMIGLQAVLAFNPLILKRLGVKCRKTKGLSCGKLVQSESMSALPPPAELLRTPDSGFTGPRCLKRAL